jgi:hypothetical protein
MPMTLLEKGGRDSARDIATSILVHDESQIEFTPARSLPRLSFDAIVLQRG